ncbi:hypothetical protein DSO57_1003052 [Entomophthora muscae]|uniref:Uncharacterized protein n=1 Tax=Entomophthora muscae TaxID=34485 RepID=A0ACC2TJJ3_9FUNG|nr:hypothetical protein DSO57_1003052 [Entomophthora muscae]
MIPKKISNFLNCPYNQVPFWHRCIMRLPIQAFIYFLLIPVPLSVITLAYLLTVDKWSVMHSLLFVWSTCEIAFFLSWKKQMQVPFIRKPFAGDLTTRVTLAQRFLAHAGNIQEAFAGWMHERPDEPLHIEYFKPLINFFFFDKKEEEMTLKEKVEAEEVYKLFNEKIPSNPDPSQPLKSFSFIDQTADDMPYHPKPLMLYLTVKALQTLTSSILYTLGFRRYVTRGLAYWFLPGNSPKPPVMYIHGLGMGYFVYLPTLHALLSSNPGRGVILVDLPHVGMAPVDVILNHDQTIKAVDAMFTRHRLEKVSLVGHSYGSLVASWLIQKRPQYLGHVHLVDPVCFMMWKHNLLYSFLFEEPKCIFHEFMRFALSKDPNISHTLSKEVYFYESMLFPEDITIPTTVFLADDEWIIDAVETKEYLEKRLPSHSNLVMMDTFHAGVVFQSDYYLELVSHI